MNEYYSSTYEYLRKSPRTNGCVSSVKDQTCPSLVEYLELANLAQDLEIRLDKVERRLSDLEWERNPGQGMMPNTYNDYWL